MVLDLSAESINNLTISLYYRFKAVSLEPWI